MEIWKKITKKSRELQGYKCDVCGKTFPYAPILIEFGFGNILDGEKYHFCKEGCAIKFLADELRKNSSVNNNFIFGKEDNLREE